MKHNIVAIYCLSFLMFLTGCADYLDQEPTDQKTMDMVWKSRKETEAYLYNVYSKLPDETDVWEKAPWLGISDEADMTWDKYYTSGINLGDWNPTSNHYNVWDDYYRAIRASFVFENNVDRCPELSEYLKTQYKAEVKFLRGHYYWLLLRQYGPFVLVDHESEIDEDWNSYPRTPFDKCVEYIVKMMDEAEENLPWEWSDKTWLGKPTKLACKAIKAEALLLAASPQWNGNTEYADFKNYDGTPLVNTSYSEQKWKDAAAASWDIIQAVEYDQPQLNIKLYYNHENGDAVFNPYISVRDVMLRKWNCEIVWARTGGNTNNYEKHATPRPGGWGGIAPTQRLVDAFYMLDGKTIDDSPLYVETGNANTAHPNWKEELTAVKTGEYWGHRVGEWNMYANREARFYMNILYNKRPVPQVSDNDRDVYSSNNNKDGWGRVEFYNTGVSGRSGSSDHPKTGYTTLKRVSSTGNPYRDNFGEWRPYAYVRLAKVYLNYIEALNEYDPTNPHIKIYWDRIRHRAGLTSIFESYPEINGNKEKQLEYILRERQIELSFETDRYFTTRRRWISHKTDTQRPASRRMYGDGGDFYGMNINVGNSFDSQEFYTRTVFETRVFDKKFYLFPINQSEMDRNKSMVQNPWW